MARLAIPAGSAALGYFVGGATGAQVGWMLGSALSQDDADVSQPKIGDLRIQTSAYGITIPLISGKQRMSGNVIWSTDKVAHTVSQDGGGKGFNATPQNTVTTYSISMAILICGGPVNGISRVWADGVLVSDYNSTRNKLPGKIYLGTDAQTPDPTITAKEGAGNVPAYRGIAYLVLTDYNLGAAGRVPNFSFEVSKSEAL